MQPHDIYDRDFDAAVDALDRWLESIADVAEIDRELTPGFWRARVTPYEASGCPVELMLSRAQRFDIDIGPETLSDQQVAGFSMFLPLLQAIAAGRVVHRSWAAAATGTDLTSEIIVRLADGRDWEMRRVVRAGNATAELTATASTQVYLPYRRA